MKMKNSKSRLLVLLILAVFGIMTVSTFTLCGGTFMQNWSGVGACTYQQEIFIGFGNPFRGYIEQVGVFAIVLFLFILLTIWLKQKKC
ncbi:hypothetical protein Q4574_05320 [Aliiglaciecola sp. 3_MG-2023]|uniref:hypothetical protein n=1 Tax=Aliiglaciecola sp. 3_MG-2023 TaxID=3062644 RepID=UPI0026E2CF78|nr:hypothetical protein [Aliiglaciecola sp. 3_MG-2023]MDO6692691.1 hypothetical protein [Aliiglaciecola sp. 3_MG-2023]